jgi:arylsulfatase A-like enzyme
MDRHLGLKVGPGPAENPYGMRGSKARIGLVSVAMICALLPLATAGSPALASGAGSTDAASPGAHPNVLLIVSDDQAWSTFSPELMPSVYNQLVDQGVLFKRAYVNTSLCCPSRAQIVSGLYEHDTGVDQNEVLLTRPTFPMALHDAGYATMLAGKYMNSWPCDPRAEFDEWACVATPEISSLSLVDPKVNIDGVWQTKTGYEPDVLQGLASNFIENTPADQPFFVMYTPTTPHLPADDTRYADMPVSPPRGPAFDVNTMTNDTPPYSRRPPLTKDEIAVSDDHYTSMAHATRSFDDAVNRLLGSLGDRAQDTLVVYLSDNGFLYGEHRRTGKNDPWEESVNVPMIVRYPAALPASRAFTSDALVQNVDIAPTIMDAVGLPWGGDGQSFLPVVERKERTVRTAALIEQCRGESRGIPDCSGYNFNGARAMTPGFQGVITQRYKYVEFDDGSRQLIDLKKDPHELHDLPRTPANAALWRQMQSRLHGLIQPRLQTTIATGPGRPFSSRVAEFSFFSPSRFATYRCRLIPDGKTAPWHSCPGGFAAFSDLADGAYRFEVAGIAESGRIDRTPASRRFTVSSGGPEVSLGTHPQASQTATSATFTYASTLPGAEFQCRLVPQNTTVEWAPCASAGAPFSDLADGGYRFEVRARDAATDEVSDPAAGWFFRVDTTGPTVAFSTAPAINTRSQSASFRFEPEELIAGSMTCTVDGKAIGCSNGRVSLPHVTVGDHTLTVKATDVAGNVGTTSYDWMVDRTRPEVGILDAPNKLSSDPLSAFNLWSNEGPGFFGCSLDGSVAMPCFGAPNFYNLKEGRHTLKVWSVDLAYNESPAITYIWKIDRTAPIVSLVGGPTEGSTSGPGETTFGVSQSEKGQLWCSLDGVQFTTCSTPIHYADLPSGDHTFEVYAVDAAGNKSLIAERTWAAA